MLWHIQTTVHALTVLFGVSLGYVEAGLIGFVKYGPIVLGLFAVVMALS